MSFTEDQKRYLAERIRTLWISTANNGGDPDSAIGKIVDYVLMSEQELADVIESHRQTSIGNLREQRAELVRKADALKAELEKRAGG